MRALISRLAALTLIALLAPLRPGVAEEGKAIVAPMELLSTRHIAVTAKLNGKGPFRMVLDTGSPITFLTARAARQIGLISEAESKQPGFAGLRGMSGLKSLEVAGAKVSDIPVLILDHPTIELVGQVAGPLDGIVGFSFFAHFDMTLDYQAKTITFAPSRYEPEDVVSTLAQRVLSGESPRRVISPSGLWGMAVEKTGASPGVEVTKVFPGSAAAEAGLRLGDRITIMDGRWTDAVRDCYEAAELAKAGDSIPVTLLRDGKELRIEVKPRSGL